MERVKADLADFLFVLDVDLPFLMPIKDDSYVVNILSQDYVVWHKTKGRGEEAFSTLHADFLPYFSSLQVQGPAFIDSIETGDHDPGSPDALDAPYHSFNIIRAILDRLNSFLVDSGQPAIFDEVPHLSYTIRYFEKGPGATQPIAQSTYPYSGAIRAKGPEQGAQVDREKLRAFLSQSVKIQAYARDASVPELAGETFLKRVFLALHMFGFYCRQHAKALAPLQEPELRDLYLILVKCLFPAAEGEVFHYDGKLDFKITNPENRFEYVTGEFKRWRGEESFREVFQQIARKHCTGQEAELYVVVISDLKDCTSLPGKISEALAGEQEFVPGSLHKCTPPAGSKELLMECTVRVRGNELPLRVNVIDVFYEKV
jgi:hypothetical protein